MRECSIDCQMSKNAYPERLKKIVQSQIDRITNGDVLLVEPNDKEIAEAFWRKK